MVPLDAVAPRYDRRVGEAEDALKRRRQADEGAANRQRDRSRASSDAARAELISEVKQLVPAALAGLRRDGWPGGRLVKIRGLFARSKEVAAWPTGRYRFRSKPDGSGERVTWLYLLSDGRWLYGESGEPESFEAILRRVAGSKGRDGSLVV